MKFFTNAFLILFLLLSIFGCEEENPKNIIAEINNDKLSMQEFRAQFTESEWNSMDEDEKKQVLDDWAEITLLAQEAKKRDLHKEPEVKYNIENARKTILANKLLEEELNKINVSEEDVFDYYNLNRAKYSTEVTSYKIQTFLVENWAIADSAIKLFNQGEAFYTVAKNLGSGYRVRWVTKDDVSSTLWNLVSGMKKWNIRVVRNNGKLMVVQLVNSQKEDVPINFNSIKDSLRNHIYQSKKQEFLENIVDSLKINYNVVIYNTELDLTEENVTDSL